MTNDKDKKFVEYEGTPVLIQHGSHAFDRKDPRHPANRKNQILEAKASEGLETPDEPRQQDLPLQKPESES